MTAGLRGAGGQVRTWAGESITRLRRSVLGSGALRGLKIAGIAIGGLLGLFVALDRVFPPPKMDASDVSVLVMDRGGRPFLAFGTAEGRWRLPVELDKVDPVFIEALLAVEDKRFYQHGGIDGVAMVRAGMSAVQRGRVVSGGSTITMQTARLLEPRPSRTVGAKLIEMFRAVQLELRYSKREILEIYLTLAPYGGNLEGLRAASWAYFGREPDRLSDAEIALLIALPQSPEVRRPDLRPKGAEAGRLAVLAKLERAGIFDARRSQEARESALPSRQSFPDMAWHVGQRLKREARDGLVVSTIDLGLQKDLERILKTRAAELDGDTQLAGLVVHIPTRGVRAMVGAAERGRPGGWLDLTDRPRSPGSTLKPFIYAMAFDDGLATPSTRISDMPKRFDTYQPENFDRGFAGDVRISDALAHSLNIPAVLTLDRIGPSRFAAQLSFAGVHPRIEGMAEREAGLALALGGAGMTAEELAMLYAALGDGGRVKPLAWTVAEEVVGTAGEGVRLVSAESAAQVLDVLRASPAPAGRVPGALTRSAPDIAFKTGTSYGFRDAWAAGVADDYAIVIWVGRPDGAPRPGKTGREAALPILFEVTDRVYSAFGVREETGARIAARERPIAPGSLAFFDDSGKPPEILFPPDKAELWAGPDREGRSRQFVLAGRAATTLTWYIDGEKSGVDDAGAPVWAPQKDGFYTVTAVDADGRASKVRVRVSGAEATVSPG